MKLPIIEEIYDIDTISLQELIESIEKHLIFIK
jgi:hypothetical protein